VSGSEWIVISGASAIAGTFLGEAALDVSLVPAVATQQLWLPHSLIGQVGEVAIWRGNLQTAITIAHEELHHQVYRRGWETIKTAKEIELWVERVAIRYAWLKRVK